MTLFYQQLKPDKWGIYNDDQLLATVSCEVTCEAIIANMASGRRDAPVSEISDLYQVPILRNQKQAPSVAQPSSSDPSTGSSPPLAKLKTKKGRTKAAKAQASKTSKSSKTAKTSKKADKSDTNPAASQRYNPKQLTQLSSTRSAQQTSSSPDAKRA
ncbi:MAG: hypothetical protein AAFY33_00290 [Cyanobacteria bacterium J06643_4]